MAVCILSDGAIGQMMEKVVLPEQKARLTEEEIKAKYPWALTGRKRGTQHRVITSLDLDSARMEEHNRALQRKYAEVTKNEVRYEMIDCDDAEYVFVAYGSSARIAQKSVQLGRAAGLKVGLLRPITLWPYPTQAIRNLIDKGVKGFLSVELSCGQMIEDVPRRWHHPHPGRSSRSYEETNYRRIRQWQKSHYKISSSLKTWFTKNQSC